MQQTIKTLRKASEQKDFIFHKENKPLAYNYYISHASNYFVRIIPRLIHHAGYEFGSGLSVNIVPPENASEYLRTLWG
jgi:galactose-1-phosphate uridylyltransferase